MTRFRWLQSSPPGYACDARRQGRFVSAIELFILGASWLLAIDQLFIVQPDLYLHEGMVPAKSLLRLVLVVAAAAGWFAPRRSYALAMLAAACGVALSGPARYWAFGHGDAAMIGASLPAVLASVGLGNALRRIPSTLRQRWNTAELAATLLQPFLATILLIALCSGAVLANALGPVRSSLALAGGLAAALVLTNASHDSLSHRWLSQNAVRRVGYVALTVLAIGAVLVERVLPLHLVLTSSHPIVFRASSERCEVEISSGQGAYHLFADSELRFSTFDEQRWADALVRPALARVQHPKRALVMSTGEGLIERELLRERSLETITSVVRCRLVPDLARRSAWLRGLTHDAMNSPRVALVERDPAAYLTDPVRERFDVIVVDLPDPSSPQYSKYYSRYFYRQLAARLEPNAVLVAQATSARRSPKTFATIGATIRAAGLAVQPGIVPLISRGEWSLYLAASGNVPDVVRPEWLAGSIAGTLPQQFSHPWPDTQAPRDFVAIPSTLHDATVLDWFEREAEPDGDESHGAVSTSRAARDHG